MENYTDFTSYNRTDIFIKDAWTFASIFLIL